RDDPGLARLGVVRGDDQQTVEAELRMLPGEVDRMGGVVGPHPRDDGDLGTDGLADRFGELELLHVGEGRRPPVVPETTIMSCPFSTRWAASFWAVSRSTLWPSSVSGVTIAVPTAPNGRALRGSV